MEPIKRISLAQEVAELLKQKIRSGAIKVGDKLPTEPELMHSLEVGRSTIREAIKYLDQSGFVKIQQGIGTIVLSNVGKNPLEDVICSSNISEVFEVRKLIEFKIVEQAALNREEEHIEAMRRHLQNRKEYGEKGMLKQCIQADIDFHVSVAESCGNVILFELYKTLSGHIFKYFFEDNKSNSRPMISQKTHEDLLDSIENRDTEMAVLLTKKLIGGI